MSIKKHKKACILSTVNLKHMTLTSLYTEYFDRRGIPYDIVYIDKYGEDEISGAENIYKYSLNINKNWPLYKKFLHYRGFKSFAEKILINKNYDFIVVWNIFTSYMFSRFLRKNYKGKYSVNIRDLGSRLNFIQNSGLNRAIKSAAFSTVSSDGFERFLPKGDYIFVHSINEELAKGFESQSKRETDQPIRIMNIGNIRFYEKCFEFINMLANDPRFLLLFCGHGSEEIEKYAKRENICNIKCIGGFQKEDTSILLKESDILYNLYGYDGRNFETALSIRFYYSVYLPAPILVYDDTYIQEKAAQCGVAFTVPHMLPANLGDRIFEMYKSFDREKAKKKCAVFLDTARKSKAMLYDKLDVYFGK